MSGGVLVHNKDLGAGSLLGAHNLCRETGSDELAAHYLERLRTDYPEQAAEYVDMGLLEEGATP